ncbi:hypothetical protein SME38J_04950 [Serratia marcescens]|nr:hypothetical protein SME38J_04950 [Serratia marcescens]
MKFINRMLTLVCCFVVSSAVLADISIVKKSSENKDKVTIAKIVFSSEVRAKSAMELVTAIDEVNINYPNLKKIYLYIFSPGGSMEAAYMVYDSVKNSKTPITTVNAAMVGSSATMFYCAAKERLATPFSQFLLHAAAAGNMNKEYLQPNDIANLKDFADFANNSFRRIYQSCTTFSSEEIDKILYSEDYRKNLGADEAVAVKMATSKVDSIPDAQIAYYIYNDVKK